MLNPDGVIVGSTRCSALGLDLNRRWHVAPPAPAFSSPESDAPTVLSACYGATTTVNPAPPIPPPELPAQSTGASGVPANARWDANKLGIPAAPSRTPTISCVRQYLHHVSCVERRCVLLFCDLHAHARSRNLFMYGCPSISSPVVHSCLNA